MNTIQRAGREPGRWRVAAIGQVAGLKPGQRALDDGEFADVVGDLRGLGVRLARGLRLRLGL